MSLITLLGYSAVPRLCGLLEKFWDYQQVVPIYNGFHGPAFPATRGKMQGGLVSLTLFNLVVDNFIITWMAMTLEDHRVGHDELVETVSCCLGVFYANGGMVGSRDADWLK